MPFNKFKLLLFNLLVGFGPFLSAQNGEQEELRSIPDTVPLIIDSLYREDQFYIGVTFNLIANKPESISQSSFSGGIHAGFIRDFPINKRRHLALGLGVGWSINTFGHNLFIGQDDQGESIFRSLDRNINYDTNRFTTQLIEVPLEFRWRTSTAKTYKFWRVYSGLRFSYIYRFRSNFVQPGNQVKQNHVEELDRFRLGTQFTFGYNTFNFHIYYSLNSLFEDARLGGEEIGMAPVRLGLMFYIL